MILCVYIYYRHSPKAPAEGVNKFINLYNKKDTNSRFARPGVQRVDAQQRVYEEVVVDEVKSYRTQPNVTNQRHEPPNHRQDQRSRDSQPEMSNGDVGNKEGQLSMFFCYDIVIL